MTSTSKVERRQAIRYACKDETDVPRMADRIAVTSPRPRCQYLRTLIYSTTTKSELDQTRTRNKAELEQGLDTSRNTQSLNVRIVNQCLPIRSA